MTTRSPLLAAVLGAALGATAIGATPPSSQSGRTPQSLNRLDFPIFDGAAWTLTSTGMEKKRVRILATQLPDDPSIPRLLAERELFDEALAALRHLVDRRPDLIAAAFEGFVLISYPDASAKARAQVAREIVALAKQRLTTLPREVAAAAAYALMRMDHQLSGEGSPGWERRIRTFLAEYDGTEAGLLAQVDALKLGRLTPTLLASLDDFAARHPRTPAAAKALYQKAFDLAHNASALQIEPRGTDPSPRFAQVLQIVRRLESGEFPPNVWSQRAPSLVWGFFVAEPTFSPASNLDAMANAYVEFAAAHWPAEPSDVFESEMEYALTSGLARKFLTRGEPISAVDRALDHLTRLRPESADTIQYMHATFYLRQLVETPAQRDELIRKAIEKLQQLHTNGREPLARYALATLASVHFYQRAYGLARDAYGEYLKRYPRSDWAWVAAFRLGQAHEQEGDLASAGAAFRRVAAEYRAVAPARVLGQVFAAEALAGLGRVSEALELLTGGLADWDDDFGAQYRSGANQVRGPDQDPYDFSDKTRVDKALLPHRISQLRESAALAGGGALERARWHLGRRDLAGARDVLLRARAEHREPAFERASRALINRAELERALTLVGGSAPDRPAGMAALERLESAPFDFHVTAAKMARATLLARAGSADAAAVMRAALLEWFDRQPGADPTPLNSLEADVAAIRRLVFRPSGDGIYATTNERWNAFDWPAAPPPFRVVNADVLVKLAEGDARRLAMRVPSDGDARVLYLDTAEIDVLNLVMRSLGGTARREPVEIMQTPNQPAGAAIDVRAFWNQFFPMRQGHWSGWIFETYPTIIDITFTDAARTRAAVRVVVGYSGCTVMLVKQDDGWRAVELINFWVT